MYFLVMLSLWVWKKDTKMWSDGLLMSIDEEYYGTQLAHASLLTCMVEYDHAMTSGAYLYV